MSVVVDTSLLVRWFVDEPCSDFVQTQIEEWRARTVDIVVQSLTLAETGNVLLKYAIDGRIDIDFACFTIEQLPRFVTVVESRSKLTSRALTLAFDVGHRSIYDMLYVALAEELDCELWTADERFWRTVQAEHSRVRRLGGEPPAAEPSAR